jgi:hypothetical protein
MVRSTVAASLVFATACVLTGGVGRDEVARATSPDGVIDAVLVETNGGATTAFGYEVHIVPRGADPSETSQAAFLYAATRGEGAVGRESPLVDSDVSIDRVPVGPVRRADEAVRSRRGPRDHRRTRRRRLRPERPTGWNALQPSRSAPRSTMSMAYADDRLWYVVMGLIVSPVIPLAVGWVRLLRSRRRTQRDSPWTVAQLLVTSASFSLIVLGLFAPSVLGADYSTRRFATIHVNLAVMLVVTVAGPILAKEVRLETLASGVLTTVAWVYLRIVNSVV